jgi:hypothetical protein
VFSELKQGVSPRDSDIGQIGRDRLRLIIGSKRIPITPQLHQQAAACEPRADAKPVERERPLVCGKGRIERSKPLQGMPASEPCVDEAWMNRERLIEREHRFTIPAQIHEAPAAPKVSIDGSRIDALRGENNPTPQGNC